MTESEASIPAPPPTSTILPDKVTLIAFLSFIIVSGGASVAIRFTYAELPPFWSGAARFICGGLFFWEAQAQILKEIYRVLEPDGVAVVGGGFGVEAPDEIIEARAAEICELNRRLGKRTLSEAELSDILEQAGLTDCTKVERRHGLWLTIRK